MGRPSTCDAVRIPYKQLNVQHTEGGSGGGIGGKLTPDTVEDYRRRLKVPEDYWLEDLDGMSPVGRRKAERLGYPTQKPVALLERIITASSNPGDLVLDPFCGCGTSVVAAHNLGRRWIGIDISANAIDIIQDRRLGPLRIQAPTFGIPQDLASAAQARRGARPVRLRRAGRSPASPDSCSTSTSAATVGSTGAGRLLAVPDDHASSLVRLAQVKGSHRHSHAAHSATSSA